MHFIQKQFTAKCDCSRRSMDQRLCGLSYLAQNFQPVIAKPNIAHYLWPFLLFLYHQTMLFIHKINYRAPIVFDNAVHIPSRLMKQYRIKWLKANLSLYVFDPSYRHLWLTSFANSQTVPTTVSVDTTFLHWSLLYQPNGLVNYICYLKSGTLCHSFAWSTL